jgi:hypothetical protein
MKNKNTLISLQDFMLTGYLGALTVGCTSNDVIAYFGKPSKYNFDRKNGLMFYNGFEFFYNPDSNIVFAIQNDSLYALLEENIYPITSKVDIDTSYLRFTDKLEYTVVVEFLRQENIPFIEVNKGNYKQIDLNSGVALDFHDDTDLLFGIRYSAK